MLSGQIADALATIFAGELVWTSYLLRYVVCILGHAFVLWLRSWFFSFCFSFFHFLFWIEGCLHSLNILFWFWFSFCFFWIFSFSLYFDWKVSLYFFLSFLDSGWAFHSSNSTLVCGRKFLSLCLKLPDLFVRFTPVNSTLLVIIFFKETYSVNMSTVSLPVCWVCGNCWLLAQRSFFLYQKHNSSI